MIHAVRDDGNFIFWNMVFFDQEARRSLGHHDDAVGFFRDFPGKSYHFFFGIGEYGVAGHHDRLFDQFQEHEQIFAPVPAEEAVFVLDIDQLDLGRSVDLIGEPDIIRKMGFLQLQSHLLGIKIDRSAIVVDGHDFAFELGREFFVDRLGQMLGKSGDAALPGRKRAQVENARGFGFLHILKFYRPLGQGVRALARLSLRLKPRNPELKLGRTKKTTLPVCERQRTFFILFELLRRKYEDVLCLYYITKRNRYAIASCFFDHLNSVIQNILEWCCGRADISIAGAVIYPQNSINDRCATAESDVGH